MDSWRLQVNPGDLASLDRNEPLSHCLLVSDGVDQRRRLFVAQLAGAEDRIA